MYALIVPVLHNFEGCTRLISSIREPFVPIVVDNWVENRGVAAGWNIGIARAMEMGINDFVISNDDVYFEDGARPSELIAPLNNNTAISMPNAGIGFACFGMNASTIDRVGWFDENFTPAYFEDNDYIYRAKLIDLRYAYTETKVVHEGSKTQFWFGDGDEERVVSHDRFRRNREYFISKWGGQPLEERFGVPFNGNKDAPIYHNPAYRRTK